MAKSPRTGDNRGRRASDKRRAAQEQVAAQPMPATASHDSGATTVRPAGANGVTKQQIAQRAYELFVARGGSHGYDIEDWLKAERELLGGR